MIENYSFTVKTKGFSDVLNLTDYILTFISQCNINSGSVLVFTPGSTCGITTIEYEPGAVQDLKAFFERVIPMNIEYRHNLRWGDGNGFSHVRASLMKSGFTFPIIDKVAVLGTWQQIILIDFDNHSREREILVQINGE